MHRREALRSNALKLLAEQDLEEGVGIGGIGEALARHTLLAALLA